LLFHPRTAAKNRPNYMPRENPLSIAGLDPNLGDEKSRQSRWPADVAL
jgi:hypothetical protein